MRHHDSQGHEHKVGKKEKQDKQVDVKELRYEYVSLSLRRGEDLFPCIVSVLDLRQEGAHQYHKYREKDKTTPFRTQLKYGVQRVVANGLQVSSAREHVKQEDKGYRRGTYQRKIEGGGPFGFEHFGPKCG
jgi:hypothetical protein